MISTVLWLLYDFLPVFRIRIRSRIPIRTVPKMSRIHNTCVKCRVLDPKTAKFRLRSGSDPQQCYFRDFLTYGTHIWIVGTTVLSRIPYGSPFPMETFNNPRYNFLQKKHHGLNFAPKRQQFYICSLAGSAILNYMWWIPVMNYGTYITQTREHSIYSAYDFIFSGAGDLFYFLFFFLYLQPQHYLLHQKFTQKLRWNFYFHEWFFK